MAVAGALSMIAAGCGDGGGSTVSQQEYDQKLELACNQGLKEREEELRKISKEFEEHGSKASESFKEENLLKLIALYEGTTKEIADIGLPEDGEEQAEEFVEAREVAVAKVKADPLGTIENLPTIFANANKLAEELEAKSCAT
jgi:5'-deoxynucleotidase YfbR-like HD superfamily hydrolase